MAKKYILPASIIHTDYRPAYKGLKKINGYEHRRINHSAGVYVVGAAHTNTIEGYPPERRTCSPKSSQSRSSNLLSLIVGIAFHRFRSKESITPATDLTISASLNSNVSLGAHGGGRSGSAQPKVVFNFGFM